MAKEKNSKYEIDMCSGSLFPKILLFTFPLIASGILQLLFNAADVIVVGRFSGSEALAAVGSTSSLTNLIINIFIGLSIGSNVMVARFYGSGNDKDVSEAVHTSVTISLLAGVFLSLIGVLLSKPLLSMMGTPEDVINLSVIYMRIYFAGMPVLMLYNFGSSILRAVGDTRRPLYYLTIAGVINVVLNLFFVIVFKLGVAGVALATVISQAVSAVLILRCLINSEGAIKINLKKLHINVPILKQIAGIGFPAGIQGALFSISNVLIQSSVNSFGSVAMAGNTAAQNLEGFVYTSMNAVHQAAVSFAGQNAGAMKYDRIKKVIIQCFFFVTGIGLILGNMLVFFGPQLLTLYTESPEVISFGVRRLTYICILYFLCGTMDVFVGILRGLGHAVITTIISLLGACLFRIIYIATYFKAHHSLEVLYASYPISWLITGLAQLIYLIIVYRKLVGKERFSSKNC